MAYFFCTLILFSTLEIVSKPLMGLVNPFLLTFYRFLLGLIVLLIFAIVTKKHKDIFKLTSKQFGILAFLGFLNIFFGMSMLQLAVRETSAATAAVIFCSCPLFVLLISILFKDESLSLKNIVPILIGAVGTFFIMRSKGVILDYGVIYAVLASMAFALFSVLGKKTVKNLSSIVVNTVSFFFGLIFLAVFIWFTDIGFNLAVFDWATPLNAKVLEILYLGVLVSGVGYITFFMTLRRLSAVSASYIFILKPSIATILAIVFLGEQVGLWFWMGLLLIVGGSVLMLGRKMIN